MTDPAAAEGSAATSAVDLGRVRDLVLQAHPDVVPDLVQGASLDALLASVEPARSAYQQIAERVRSGGNGSNGGSPNPAPPAVPAGGTRAALDPATLSPVTKIARALAARSAAGGVASLRG